MYDPINWYQSQRSTVDLWFASVDPTLPAPWRSVMDESSGLVFYWNPETNVPQYEYPHPPPPLPPHPPPDHYQFPFEYTPTFPSSDLTYRPPDYPASYMPELPVAPSYTSPILLPPPAPPSVVSSDPDVVAAAVDVCHEHLRSQVEDVCDSIALLENQQASFQKSLDLLSDSNTAFQSSMASRFASFQKLLLDELRHLQSSLPPNPPTTVPPISVSPTSVPAATVPPTATPNLQPHSAPSFLLQPHPTWASAYLTHPHLTNSLLTPHPPGPPHLPIQ